jgi:Viral BACON domain
MIAYIANKFMHSILAGVFLLMLVSCGGGGGASTPTPPINGGIEVTPSSVEVSGVCEVYEPAYSGISIRPVSPEVDSLSVDYAPGASEQPWLGVQFVDMPGNVGFNFTIEGSSLEPGTYTSALRLTTLRANKSVIGYVDVPITFKNKRQLFLYGDGKIAGGHIIGSGEPISPSEFQLYGKGISWTAKVDQAWMTLNTPNGTAPGKGTLSFDITKMQMGLNKGTLVFTPTDTSAPLTAEVTFYLSPTTLQVLNPGLNFNFIKGEQLLRPDKFFDVGSNGGPLKWTAIADVPWISLSTTSGTARLGASSTNVVVKANVMNLSVGQYSGTIKITDDSGAVQTLPVTLDYRTPSLQNVGVTTSLNFESVIGGTPPASATPSIVSNGDPVDWAAKTNQSWIKLGNSTGMTSAQLPVTVDPTGLVVGTYNGSIAISSSSGGDYLIQVAYTIKPKP